MGYFKKTLTGITWMGGLRGTTRAIAFLKIIILARILSPSEFGLFGIASLILAFLEIFTETGINAFLIQEKSNIEKFVNTAWVISIVRGILISLLLLLSANFLTIFFDAPESKNLIYLIAVIPFLRGFINPSIVKFQKDLTFNKEFYYKTLSFVIDSGVAIWLAVTIKSASALVFGMIAGVIVELFISYLWIKPIPRLSFELDKLKLVLSRGKWITLWGILDYFYQHGDDIVVGKLLGTYSLGLYQTAYRVAILPVSEGGEIFNKVTFPVYVKIREDGDRLKRVFIKILITVAIFVIPFGLVLVLFPDWFVNTVLGIKWIEIVPVLPFLAIYAVLRAILGTSQSLFLALKKQKYVVYTLLVALAGMAIFIVPLVNNYGILGAGISALLGWLLAIPVIIYFIKKVFKG